MRVVLTPVLGALVDAFDAGVLRGPVREGPCSGPC